MLGINAFRRAVLGTLLIIATPESNGKDFWVGETVPKPRQALEFKSGKRRGTQCVLATILAGLGHRQGMKAKHSADGNQAPR